MKGIMNISVKKEFAFTLMELMIALVIVGIVSVVTVKILASRSDYIYKYMYNATLKDLKMGIGTLIAEGIPDAKGSLYKYLPDKGHTTDEDGFCDRLTSLMNTLGPTDCSRTVDSVGPFDLTTANFITTNGMRFFNFGAASTDNMFTIYVDIDGAKGKSQLNSDVYRFWIDRCGQILTSYSTTCTINIPGVSSPTTDPNCGNSGVVYSQPGGIGTTIYVNDSTTGQNCSAKNYTCGTSGYSYGINSGIVYRYDKTAHDAGTELPCISWPCGSTTSPGTGPKYDQPGGIGKDIYAYDLTAYTAGSSLTCSSWDCGVNGLTTTYDTNYTLRSDIDSKAINTLGKTFVCQQYSCTTSDYLGSPSFGYEAKITTCGGPPVNCKYTASLSVSGYYCATAGGYPDNSSYTGCTLTGSTSGAAGTSCASYCSAGSNWGPITYNGVSNYLSQQLTCSSVDPASYTMTTTDSVVYSQCNGSYAGTNPTGDECTAANWDQCETCVQVSTAPGSPSTKITSSCTASSNVLTSTQKTNYNTISRADGGASYTYDLYQTYTTITCIQN